MQNTKQKSGTKQKLTIAAIFGAMGPGLLAALSGNDAGGIATYSSAGASYGYKMLWMLPVMTVLLIVTQETAARTAPGGTVTLTAGNAQAWAEVYQDGIGWMPLALPPVSCVPLS